MSVEPLHLPLARRDARRAAAGEPNVLVVGSGKGGVGKSVLSVLLAACAAAQGHRTLLFDADMNLANLHVLLDVRPKARLEAVLHEGASPAELVQQVGESLWLLPGNSGTEALQSLDTLDRARLHHRLSELYDGFDVVVVDAGAGIDGVLRVAQMRATRLIVVTLPEPTALTDAYALIKIANLQAADLPVDVIVNRVDHEDEGRGAYERLATGCERFLRRGIRYLGSIPEDELIRLAVRDPRRLLHLLQQSPAARALRELVLDRLELPTPLRSVG